MGLKLKDFKYGGLLKKLAGGSRLQFHFPISPVLNCPLLGPPQIAPKKIRAKSSCPVIENDLNINS